MEEPMDDRPLPQHAGIDSYLASARETLTAQLVGGLNLDAGLDAIFGDGEEPPSGRPVAAEPAGPAARAIWIRRRAANQDLEIQQTARHLGLYFTSRPLEYGIPIDTMLALMRSLDKIETRAKALAHTICAEGHGDDYTSDTASAVVSILAGVKKKMMVIQDVPDRHLLGPVGETIAASCTDSLNEAMHEARKLLSRMLSLEVDASGADLSSLGRIEVQLLAGVVWTDETVWPAGTDCHDLRARSAEIAPGVYQVAEGRERDRSDLVTR
jgi:hypothetical protein